ncbi:hypothetical protein [Loktanella sp. Alg231-35]|uniref:hypothetical protein n=1 Tax=Loktanella sp. Alg231-35 TaxID=1922220 RepID=UPI000D558C31|nr:hypothetical protein [Loktanella sp. Alg231-35]
MEEYLLVYGVPTVAFLVATFAGFQCGKAGSRSGLGWFAGIWVAFTTWMFMGIQSSTGWDGLGYVLALIGICAPVGVGGLIGGVTGWIKRDEPKLA